MTQQSRSAVLGQADTEATSVGFAVLSPELRDRGKVVRCAASELLRGSLRRAGVPIRERSALDTGDDSLTVYREPVRGRDDLAIFAGASDEHRATVERSVAEWSAVTASRRVLLASPRSFCAGVERAIEIVERILESRQSPVFVRKQIVHNSHVIDDLASRGAKFVDELDEIPDGATVVFSAHGVSPAVRQEAARRGLEVIDGSCPLVTKVHSEAKRFAARGDTIVLIGHAGHEEVEGTMGEAPDSTVLVETAEDVAALDLPDAERVSYLTQTTLGVDETAEVVKALRTRFPALREPPTDDICYATTNRQNAVKAIMEKSDLVLVVGSPNSSNSVRLAETPRRAGTSSHLIGDASDIRPEWLAGVRTVGVTSGASTPPGPVDQVVAALRGLGEVTIEEHAVAHETVHFGLPVAVRRQTD
ncbi:4-hydroxy-3-methylbut-2-enyl diphosphate reductase [Amycolatopsis sp. WAC 04197]|uniref:4-hydroxy-3-methylbut-2-enyl diphosphate reductase n=1 Tax=Amycolatopsis sp. WAC 04197 TaxID=2203199 RepID=UPI000F78411C|nr:4-hydroxy-3-methylbut-2-enyl diphosphate reductase [Amycolatopsis sp. WAC 04197]RSN39722.1 4-hydroxy-3-methylbut-2-enyl diphosphate reductase [Amycolatopsis sp. WAC 04197]